METLVVVVGCEHRNHQHYYSGRSSSRVKGHGLARFGSSPSTHFQAINCRTSQSGSGLLPTPFKDSAAAETPPSPTIKSHSNEHARSKAKTACKSSPIPINVRVAKKEAPSDDQFGFSDEAFAFSELWAGPAYSNSPPPSSLPIPKFSVRSKRTLSLDLPASDSDVRVQPTAKSAPASPAREHSSPAREMFLNTDSVTTVTKTLRRILNLDAADE